MPEVPSLAEFKFLNPDQKYAQIHQRLADLVEVFGTFGGAANGSVGTPGQLQIKAPTGNGFAALPYAGWTGSTMEMPTQRLYRAKPNDANYDRFYFGWDSINDRWTIQQEVLGTFVKKPLMVKAGTDLILTYGTGQVAVRLFGGALAPYSGSDVNLGTPQSPYQITYTNALNLTVREVTATTTVLATDGTLSIDASGGSLTINIPAPSAGMDGRILTLKRIDENISATVTIVTDGLNSETLPATLDSLNNGEGPSGLILQVIGGWTAIGSF